MIAGIVRGLRPADFGLTVTTLIGCLRKARLMQTEPYWLKPAESYWSYRGQLMHGVAAQYADEADQIIAEQRLSIVIETLTGALRAAWQLRVDKNTAQTRKKKRKPPSR